METEETTVDGKTDVINRLVAELNTLKTQNEKLLEVLKNPTPGDLKHNRADTFVGILELLSSDIKTYGGAKLWPWCLWLDDIAEVIVAAIAYAEE